MHSDVVRQRVESVAKVPVTQKGTQNHSRRRAGHLCTHAGQGEGTWPPTADKDQRAGSVIRGVGVDRTPGATAGQAREQVMVTGQLPDG